MSEMIRAVQDVLHEIGADEASQVLVLSKADRVDEERRRELELRHRGCGARRPTPEGLEELAERIDNGSSSARSRAWSC